MKHKHAEQIIAWANGSEIECKPEGGTVWECTNNPAWYTYSEYRVKDPYRELKEALSNGELIEMVYGNGWTGIDNPHWSEPVENYRIKSKEEYIPFDFSDAEKIIGKAVRDKKVKSVFSISKVYDRGMGLMIVIGCDEFRSSSTLLCNFTFLDNSPCGKLKQ